MRRLTFLAIVILFLFPLVSFADSIKQLVVFGDSLSDTGNDYLATNGAEPPSPAYSGGLFTDGPGSVPSTSSPVGIWVQQLAGMLGLPSPAPVLTPGGGTDYAFGGALTGFDPSFPGNPTAIPYVGDQVNLFLAANPTGIPSTALYTFWAGANDIFDNPSLQTAQTAVANLMASINTLYGDGARNFLWLNMPPLGNTPDILATGQSAAFNLLSEQYNADWLTAISSLEAQDPGIDLVGVNVYALVESMLSDPSAYGLTNVTTPAQGMNVNPNDYLYWDGIHPTTKGNFWVASLAGHDLVTPESSTALLIGIGLLAALFLLERRQGKHGAF